MILYIYTLNKNQTCLQFKNLTLLLVLNLYREMALFKKWGGSGRETIYLGRTPGVKDGPKPRWQVFWRKINRGKKKIFNVSPVTSQASYDLDEYSQNFDQGTDWAEPEILSRSFSARFADPSRILQKSRTVR